VVFWFAEKERSLRVFPSLIHNFSWRTVYRLGYPIAGLWWRIRRPSYEGTLVAVYVGSATLLLRPSYRPGWNFPGGGVRRGELPEEAARRELEEETGIVAPSLQAMGHINGVWNGRHEVVHFFGLWLDQAPELKIDQREIIEARFVSPETLSRMRLTGPVAVYLKQRGQDAG
jgi:8-oxo-dGTP pyrophosphatase MutT (NUDIX family)